MFSYLQPIFNKTLINVWVLLKFMIPIIICVKFAEELNILTYLTYPFMPVMDFLGIPPIYAVVWLVAIFNGNYGAFSMILVLFHDYGLTYEQLTVLSLVCLIAHNLFVESAIAYKLGVKTSYIVILRVFTALLLGLIVHYFCTYFSYLQEDVSNILMQNTGDKQLSLLSIWNLADFNVHFQVWQSNIYKWLISQVKVVFYIFAVIFLVFITVQILKDLNIMHAINKHFNIFAKSLRITRSNSMITLICFLIGISYGWGLLNEESSSNNTFKKEQSLKVVSFISIAHGVVEDSMIFIMLGSNWWITIFVRIIWCFIIIWILSNFILPKLSKKVKRKYLYFK
jgi:hypothetical protein